MRNLLIRPLSLPEMITRSTSTKDVTDNANVIRADRRRCIVAGSETFGCRLADEVGESDDVLIKHQSGNS